MHAWSPLQTSSSTPYLHAHDTLAAFEQRRDPRLDAALALELALALGDDHFEAGERRGERLFERAPHRRDVVACAPCASSCTPRPSSVRSMVWLLIDEALLRLSGGARLRLVVRRRDDVLRAGGRGVAVLHDDQHCVVAVEQRALHAGQQAVVPEAAVAHDRQRAAVHHRRRRRRGSRGSCRSRGSSGRTRTARRSRARGSRCRPRCAPGRPPAARASAPRTPAARGSRCRTPAAAPAAAPTAAARPRRGAARCRRATSRRASGRARGRCSRAELQQRLARSTSTVYSPAAGSRSLPCTGVCTSRRRSAVTMSFSMYSGAALPRSPAPRACRRRTSPDLASAPAGTSTFSTSDRQLRRHRTRRPARAAAARGRARCTARPARSGRRRRARRRSARSSRCSAM